MNLPALAASLGYAISVGIATGIAVLAVIGSVFLVAWMTERNGR